MISVDGAGGDDEISGLGDHGTGRPDGNWEDASPLDDGLPPEAELLPRDSGTGPIVDAITDFGPDPWDGLVISGGSGDDDIQGGEDNDVLSGGGGDDVIDGAKSREFPGLVEVPLVARRVLARMRRLASWCPLINGFRCSGVT
jgi:hypothetical protein